MSSALLLLAAALAAPGRAVVFPSPGPQSAGPGWIGAAVEETLPRALQRAGRDAVSAADRRRALEALGINGPVATRAAGVRAADTLGARLVLFGSWDLRDAELTLTLRPFDTSLAELRAPIVARGPLEALGRLIEELALPLAGVPPAPARAGSRAVPFAALRALGEGLAARDAEARIRGVERALALHPDHPEAGLALARLLHDASRFAEAREVLAAVAEPLFERERRFLDGACLLGLGRHAEADALYAGLAASEPTAAVLANRAIARLRRADAAGGASALLRQAVESVPSAAELPFGLGFAHFVEGDAEAASFWLKDAVRYAPGDARARLALSWALRRSGRGDEADEQWRAAAALDASLESLRLADPQQRLERVLPSEGALLLDPERRADTSRVLRER